jgi:hypothetical protein
MNNTSNEYFKTTKLILYSLYQNQVSENGWKQEEKINS